jgi:hypothetical protein
MNPILFAKKYFVEPIFPCSLIKSLVNFQINSVPECNISRPRLSHSLRVFCIKSLNRYVVGATEFCTWTSISFPLRREGYLISIIHNSFSILDDALNLASSNIINYCIYCNVLLLPCQDKIKTKSVCNIFINKQTASSTSLSTTLKLADGRRHK